MKYESQNEKLILSGCNSFDIGETLECGQVFRFNKLAEREYVLIAHGKVLHIRQEGGLTEFYPCTPEEFESIWLNYFDLNRDYSEIKSILSQDPIMEKATAFAGGIRILNQDPWEMLLSFIISQNMNIPRIKSIVLTLSEMYGEPIGDYYAFPTLHSLKDVTEDELRQCKTGFRAKYLHDAIRRVATGEINFARFPQKTTAEAKAALTEIYGVGEKVADCVLLFSCGRHEVFPMDVWIKRVMQQLYFNGQDAKPKAVYQFAQEKFGDLAGFAQQYLFHYARMKGAAN